MRKLDTEFLEEYKRVETVCGDMFGCRAGVSEYIKTMEATPEYKRELVEGWDSSFKKLKHLRWIRNKIAHEPDFDECEKADLTDLKLFHADLLKSRDPLARLARAEKEMQKLKKRAASSAGGDDLPVGKWLAAALIVIVVILIANRFF